MSLIIPHRLLYRVYGESLAIIIDLNEDRAVLLQNEALRAWKGIIEGGHDSDNRHSSAVREQLAGLGLIEDSGIKLRPRQGGISVTKDVTELDFSAINYWAFKNRIPISGHFELTSRCNLRCRHCYCVFDRKDDTLSTEQVLAILDNLYDNGTFGLVLTGGEVFVRGDILEILDQLAKRKFILRINTNGTLINENVVRVLASLPNIFRIHISLYGSTSDVHDRITNVPGSFRNTMNALRLLRDAGVRLRINCSVMKSNFHDYKNIKRVVGDKLGIPVHYDPAIFPRDDGSTENLKEELNSALFQEFERFKNGLFPATEAGASLRKKPKLCKAGFSFFSICEDGKVYPCLKMKRFYRNPLGNLVETPLESIWSESAPVQRIRDAMSNKLRECNICDIIV